MKVNEWFLNGSNYNEGVLLYASLQGHSSNLVRLFLRKESPANLEKLSYELGKHREVFFSNKEANDPKKDVQRKTESFVKTSSDPGGFYRINQLPTQLHPLLIKQRNDFQTAISLHAQLTQLHPDEEGAAVTLCIQIEDLFDALATAQKILDHYVKHKVVLNIESRNFEDLSPAQLLRSRNNKSSRVSKYKKKIDVLKQTLGNVSKAEKTKRTIALEKAASLLLQHELELQQLNELING